MIRSCSFSISEGNSTKLNLLKEFKNEYSNVTIKLIEYLWSTRIEYNNRILDVNQGLYDCPLMMSSIPDLGSFLSARAIKCAATQACAIVRSVLKARIKQENKLIYCKSKGYNYSKLEEKLKNLPSKPNLTSINPEINSIIVNIGESNNKFDMWLNFSSLFKNKRGLKISIPLKHHRHSNKIATESIGRKASILLCDNSVNIRYELPEIPKKRNGEVLSIDQGITDIITTNRNDQIATDIHGWTLSKILHKMSKLKLGSLAFARAKAHLRNYINYVIKRIDLNDVKEIKLEDIFNIKFKSNVSRLLKHWSNPLIRDSLIKVCEEKGVLLTLVPNEYNSQRCSKCGWTHKSNRKGKVFKCNNCGSVLDADHNASINILHRDNLVEIPYGFRNLKHNIKGFFWDEIKLCDKFGEELTVPQSQKINIH